jgi:high-affinity Fe2+/Pb2+ permease
MKGFFGWHNEAENIRLIAYFAYLIPITWAFLAGSRESSAPARVQNDKVGAAAQ